MTDRERNRDERPWWVWLLVLVAFEGLNLAAMVGMRAHYVAVLSGVERDLARVSRQVATSDEDRGEFRARLVAQDARLAEQSLMREEYQAYVGTLYDMLVRQGMHPPAPPPAKPEKETP